MPAPGESLTFFMFFRDAAGAWTNRTWEAMDTDLQSAKKPRNEESLMKLHWKPRPVLAKELTRQPVLEKCFVGVLKDKRCISKAITGLASCLPSPQFLKRCSVLRIYLAPVDKPFSTAEELKLFLVEKGFDLSLMEDDLEVVEIPSVAPKTKSQMCFSSKFWPVNFHPDLSLEALISGSLFNNEQLVSLETCMRLVIRAAELAAVGSDECNGSALIVNPEEGTILALAAASLDKHPMWHAAMIAVDLVARLQGGGAWNLLDPAVDQAEDSELKRKHQKEALLCFPSCLSEIEMPKGESLTFSTDKPKKSKEVKKELDEKCGPYLCTGYWAILLQEPCPLCAMALLHSRVSRIFYGAANPKTGILGSKETLHSVPGLNHRYQVWSSVLEDECIRILNKCRKIDL